MLVHVAAILNMTPTLELLSNLGQDGVSAKSCSARPIQNHANKCRQQFYSFKTSVHEHVDRYERYLLPTTVLGLHE